MATKSIKQYTILVLFVNILFVRCFVPADLIHYVFSKVDSKFLKSFDVASETLTHDDILKYGLIQSVVEYYYNQSNGTQVINISKIDTGYYYDLKNLYRDVYGLYLCDIRFDNLIKIMFQMFVALVDLDPDTKDFPYAHFDAETFIESNNRVIDFTSTIMTAIQNKDYETAQKFSGYVLHTIHDFYSHSNWVEMGNTDINTKIGTKDFANQTFVNKNESNTCFNNCTLITVECSTYMKIFTKLMSLLFKKSITDCPIKYYKCTGNIATSNKLVSGYYAGQKLENGQTVDKPTNLFKCSHGGILDSTVKIPAEGGINKDSGYYILSPHADLHQTAAKLAIKHTKYFFDVIRQKVGDDTYAEFLEIKPTSEEYTNENRIPHICGAIHANQMTLFTIGTNFVVLIILHKFNDYF